VNDTCGAGRRVFKLADLFLKSTAEATGPWRGVENCAVDLLGLGTKKVIERVFLLRKDRPDRSRLEMFAQSDEVLACSLGG